MGPSRSPQRKPLPKHDPNDNEMISKLAKKRVENILSQKKQIDSGVRRSPPKPKPPTSKKPLSYDVRKWQLAQPPVDPSASAPISAPDEDDEGGRPKFSYKKKASVSVFN